MHVSLNQGMASIELAPSNRASLRQIRQAIRNQGFNPQGARVSAVGRLESVRGQLQLQVTGSPDVFSVVATPHASWTQYAGKTELVRGLVPAGTGALSIQITSVRSPGGAQ